MNFNGRSKAKPKGGNNSLCEKSQNPNFNCNYNGMCTNVVTLISVVDNI